MPRPAHAGFLIPNAADVASPQMAEPDRIDFNTLGNSRYGVIEGCVVSVSLTSATNTAGTAIVNGTLVPMAGGQSAELGTSGTQDRYDLLTVDINGKLVIVPGTPAADPVFPDPPVNATVLAAVFCPAGATSVSANVIDKRNFLSDSLQTKIASSSSLVANRNGTGDMFRIDGAGVTAWGGDTYLQRTAPKTLKLTENLNLDGTLHVGADATVWESLTVTGSIRGLNLQSGPGNPPAGLLSSPAGLYQGGNGKLFVYQNNAWQELATVASAIPVGTVITSLVAKDSIGAGWVPLDGVTVVQEDDYPKLFLIPALTSYINSSTVAPHRTMILPDARQRVLLGDFTAAGTYGGENTFSINLANLPAHKHGATGGESTRVWLTGSVGQGGGHGHITKAAEGVHGHEVSDPGHKHLGAESPAGGAFVALSWNGQNKIDAYFNDRSHTYSVEAADWTGAAFTNVRVTVLGSEHQHTAVPVDDHTHPLSLDPITVELPAITENSVGGNAPINYQPAYLAVYVYIRA